MPHNGNDAPTDGTYFYSIREDMTVDDAKSAINLIADDLEMYQDESLVETLLGGFKDFLDGPARVRQSFPWGPTPMVIPLHHCRKMSAPSV